MASGTCTSWGLGGGMKTKALIGDRGREVLSELQGFSCDLKSRQTMRWIDSEGVHSDLIIARNALRAARKKMEIAK